MLPSERVISWVNVYGLFGRRRRVAFRHWVQMYVAVFVGVVEVGRFVAVAVAVLIRLRVCGMVWPLFFFFFSFLGLGCFQLNPGVVGGCCKFEGRE